MRIKSLIVFSSLGLFFFSCNDNAVKHDPYTDTPTSGEINIIVDESYQPMMQVQIDTFMEIYKYAKIHVRYLPEEKLFSELLNNDSVRLAVTARPLNEYESKNFEQQKIIPRTLKIAKDALALIVNPANKDTLLSEEKLKQIFTGKVSTWNQLNKTSIKDSIIIVFDKNGSANARYLKEKFSGKEKLPPNSYATNSNADVVGYVSETPGAIGIISVNWISDRDEPEANKFLKRIKVVALSSSDSLGTESDYYQPLQAYIALKNYPLTRDVSIISREGRNGLGTGFASFVAGDKGQRMIRLMGLLPAVMPVRIIQVN